MAKAAMPRSKLDERMIQLGYVEESVVWRPGDKPFREVRRERPWFFLKNLFDVLSVTETAPVDVEDISVRSGNDTLWLHPVAALYYATDLGKAAVDRLTTHLKGRSKKPKGAGAVSASVSGALGAKASHREQEVEQKPKLELEASDSKQKALPVLTKKGLSLLAAPVYPSFYAGLNDRDKGLVERVLKTSGSTEISKIKLPLVVDMDLTLLQVVKSVESAWTTDDVSQLHRVTYRGKERLFEMVPGIIGMLCRIGELFDLHVLTASELELAQLQCGVMATMANKKDLFASVVSVNTKGNVTLKTFQAVGVCPELAVALDDTVAAWHPSCMANVIPAPAYGNATKHQRERQDGEREEGAMNQKWDPALYIKQLEQVLRRAHGALLQRIVQDAMTLPTTHSSLVNMADVVRLELNRMLVKNTVRLCRYKGKEDRKGVELGSGGKRRRTTGDTAAAEED